MKRLVPVLAALSFLLFSPSTAIAQSSNPNEKTTVTDIQYRVSYSQEIPGNCGVFGFSQWEASKFKGWVATSVTITLGTPPNTRTDTLMVSQPPLYDDQLAYGGNILSPPAGTHWVLIGDGSYRAGPPPADPDCLAMLARSQANVPDHKVTTRYIRTPVCATRYRALTDAERAVKKAKAKLKKAKLAKKAQARKKLSQAKKKLSKVEKTFYMDCSK